MLKKIGKSGTANSGDLITQMAPIFGNGVVLDAMGEADRLAYRTFPKGCRARLHSTNHIECLNGEIRRRTQVGGIFPNDAAITRLVGALLLEQNDNWVVRCARYVPLQTMAPFCDDSVIGLPIVAR